MVETAQDVIRNAARKFAFLSSDVRILDSAAYNVLIDAILYLDGEAIRSGRFVDQVERIAQFS